MLHLSHSSLLSALPPSRLALPKSLLHIEDNVVLLKCKSGQVTTQIKVLQRHSMSLTIKLNKILQDPNSGSHDVSISCHSFAISALQPRLPPCLLSSIPSKASLQGFCSWRSFCPISPLNVLVRALVVAFPDHSTYKVSVQGPLLLFGFAA